MQATRSKLQLSENHRRVISALLRGVERRCEEMADWLDRTSGLLQRVEDDLRPGEAARLHKLLGQVRAEIARFNDEVPLTPGRESRRRALAALVTTGVTDLAESQSQHLKGYGKMPEETARALDAKLARLLVLLEEMQRIVESA